MAGKFDFFQICLPEGIEQERKKSSVLAGESNRGRVLLSLFNYVTTTRITWSTWPSADCCSLVKSNDNLTSEKVQIQSWQTVLNDEHRPCRPCRVEGGGFVEKLPAKNPQPSQKNREDSWRTSERPSSSSSSSVGTSRGILAPKNPQSIGKESIFYEAEARGGQLLRASLLKKRSSVPFHSTGKQPLARCDVRAPVTSRTLMTSPSVVIVGVPNHANDPPLFNYYLILFISLKKKNFFFTGGDSEVVLWAILSAGNDVLTRLFRWCQIFDDRLLVISWFE